jgi:hypothetical protein
MRAGPDGKYMHTGDSLCQIPIQVLTTQTRLFSSIKEFPVGSKQVWSSNLWRSNEDSWPAHTQLAHLLDWVSADLRSHMNKVVAHEARPIHLGGPRSPPFGSPTGPPHKRDPPMWHLSRVETRLVFSSMNSEGTGDRQASNKPV